MILQHLHFLMLFWNGLIITFKLKIVLNLGFWLICFPCLNIIHLYYTIIVCLDNCVSQPLIQCVRTPPWGLHTNTETNISLDIELEWSGHWEQRERDISKNGWLHNLLFGAPWAEIFTILPSYRFQMWRLPPDLANLQIYF